MSKASGKVKKKKKKKIYFCTNVILSVMYTWIVRREGGLVLFLLRSSRWMFPGTRWDGAGAEPGLWRHGTGCGTAARAPSLWAATCCHAPRNSDCEIAPTGPLCSVGRRARATNGGVGLVEKRKTQTWEEKQQNMSV